MNAGKIPVIFIEAQAGEYMVEDPSVILADNYQRSV